MHMKAQKTHQSKPYESTKKPISLNHMKKKKKKTPLEAGIRSRVLSPGLKAELPFMRI